MKAVAYSLQLDDTAIPLNQYLGSTLSIHFTGKIHCQNCGRQTPKSYNQGYCYPCFSTLARCDLCQLKPELCHFHKETCREPAWGKENCFIDHSVYLSNSSGLKVGITRSYQQIHRWMDQGAVSAVPIARVPSRLNSGVVEEHFKQFVNDKTNWRVMLKNAQAEIDLLEQRQIFLDNWPSNIEAQEVEEDVHFFKYPVLTYPDKIKSHNFDKDPLLEGELTGIKGQYLMFGDVVCNIRKFSGYEVSLRFN